MLLTFGPSSKTAVITAGSSSLSRVRREVEMNSLSKLDDMVS